MDSDKTAWKHRYFYPRVIAFTIDELTLLNKGLKYNLNHKQKNWIKTLTLEAESAITQLPTHEQDHIRYQVAHNVTRLYKQQGEKLANNSIQNMRKTINQIKEKLVTAMISKSDKCNSIVIVYQEEYHRTVINVISNNNLRSVNNDPTKKFP